MPSNANNGETTRAAQRTGNHTGGNTLLELIVAFVGAIMVVGVLIFLLASALRNQGQPPSLSFDITAIQPVAGGYVVTLTVVNEGDIIAAGVTVVGQLSDGDTLIEEREMTFDYVPPQSTRRGGLFFSHDPSNGTLTFYPGGYQEP